jgi:hypothetical protein
MYVFMCMCVFVCRRRQRQEGHEDMLLNPLIIYEMDGNFGLNLILRGLMEIQLLWIIIFLVLYRLETEIFTSEYMIDKFLQWDVTSQPCHLPEESSLCHLIDKTKDTKLRKHNNNKIKIMFVNNFTV